MEAIKLPMTAHEIVMSYKYAVNKEAQIGILAELNATDTEIIKAVLGAAKMDLPKVKEKTPKEKKGAVKVEKPKGRKIINWTDEMEEILKTMYFDGNGPKEIAEELGLDRTAISNKLARSGIRKEYQKLMEQRKEPTETVKEDKPKQVSKYLKKAENVEPIEPTQAEPKEDDVYIDGIGDTVDTACEVVGLLDVLQAIDYTALKATDSTQILVETAYNLANSLFCDLDDIHLGLIGKKLADKEKRP